MEYSRKIIFFWRFSCTKVRPSLWEGENFEIVMIKKLVAYDVMFERFFRKVTKMLMTNYQNMGFCRHFLLN